MYMTLYYAQYSTDGKKKRVCKTCVEKHNITKGLKDEKLRNLHPNLHPVSSVDINDEKRITYLNLELQSVMEDFKHCGDLVTGAREFINTITQNVENAKQHAKNARNTIALAESYQKL